MEYGRIIKRAWDVTWRHKVLWVFGIAASVFGASRFPSSNGGGAGQGLQYALSGDEFDKLRRSLSFVLPGPGMMGRGMHPGNMVPVIAGILGILLIFAVVMFFLRLVVRLTSLGALVGMVNEIEETEETSFKSGLQRGWRRLLHLFVIELIVGIVTAVVVIAMLLVFGAVGLLAALPVVALFQASTAMGVIAILAAVALGLGLLLVFILATIVLSFAAETTVEYAYRQSVINLKGIISSLGDAIALTRAHLQESALMWLLLAAINLGLAILSIPLVLIAIGAIVGPAFAIYGVTRSVVAGMLAAVPLILFWILAGAFLGGLYLTFRSAVWTLTFRELGGHLGEPA